MQNTQLVNPAVFVAPDDKYDPDLVDVADLTPCVTVLPFLHPIL